MGSTNFQQWNPSAANQESDAAYTSDAQRAGGAASGAVFPSATANKLFFQVSTAVAALMQMMANKGYTVSDTNLATLTSVLAAIQTTADTRSSLQSLSYSPVQNCNVSAFLGFEMPLNSNVTINISGGIVGDRISFILNQDATGSRLITWSGNVIYGFQPDPTPSGQSIISFIMNAAGQWAPDGPVVTTTGSMHANSLDGTPVGAEFASTGIFTNLNANTPSTTDNSTKAATTAFVNAFVAAYLATSGAGGGAFSLGVNGYIKFPSWLGGLIIQWGEGPNIGGGSSTSVSFPLAFPTAVFNIMVAATYAIGQHTSVQSVQNGSWSLSSFTVVSGSGSDTDGNAPFFWIAIGH